VFNREYVYSNHVSGSVGILPILHVFALVHVQNVHCVHTVCHVYVTSCPFVGSGYLHSFKLYNVSVFSITHISDVLVLSLAIDAYHCNDIKAIVHSIASIAITTINSTRVNALVFC